MSEFKVKVEAILESHNINTARQHMEAVVKGITIRNQKGDHAALKLTIEQVLSPEQVKVKAAIEEVKFVLSCEVGHGNRMALGRAVEHLEELL